MNENPFSRMDKDAQRIAYLVAGYIRNTLTEAEHDELDEWVNESDHNMKLFEDLTDEKNLKANLAWMSGLNTDQALARISRHRSVVRKPVMRFAAWLAAASVIIMASLIFLNRNSSSEAIEQIKPAAALPQPGGLRASVTLSDGNVINLETLKTGDIKRDAGSQLKIMAGGLLSYSAENGEADSTSSNILATPAGGQYELELEDGTKVWLNAESSIKYPVHFASRERTVQLHGEGYFEVAKNANKPFKVRLADSSVVTVLGTHFNIRSYEDELEKQVALIEGKVAVNTTSGNELLQPGSMVTISDQRMSRSDQIDTEEILAWKNGNFNFHDAAIEEIMNQIKRWYNVKVEYKAEIRQLFNATMPRTESLPKVLHLLELNGYVHFKIENSTIYVLP